MRVWRLRRSGSPRATADAVDEIDRVDKIGHARVTFGFAGRPDFVDCVEFVDFVGRAGTRGGAMLNGECRRRAPLAGRSGLRPSPRRRASRPKHGVTGRWSIQSEEAARGNDGVEIAVAADDGGPARNRKITISSPLQRLYGAWMTTETTAGGGWSRTLRERPERVEEDCVGAEDRVP